MFVTDLETKDIPTTFHRFREAVGEEHWTKRASLIHQEIRGNQFLEALLLEEYSIVLALDRCSAVFRKLRTLPHDLTLDKSIYPAIAFAAQCLSFVENSPGPTQKGLLGRIRGSFRNSEDLRALQLEFHSATHFSRLGHRISWPETDRTGRVDLFVPSLGPVGLQVECKAISVDKGRKIHRREALVFWHKLDKALGPTTRQLRVGLSVVLTIPDRLPKDFSTQKALISEIRGCFLLGSSQSLSDGSHLRISEFDFAKSVSFDASGQPRISRDEIDRVSGTRNREAMLHFSRRGGVVFVLQSAKEDSFLDYVFETLKDAADRQLDPECPGLLVAAFQGIGPDGLYDVAGQDVFRRGPPTALRQRASAFFAKDSRPNITGLAFLSREVLGDVGDSFVHGGSAAYHFPNRDGSFWHEAFEGMFREAE